MLQTLAFPAGGRQIDAKATFIRYESGNAGGLDTTIKVRADGNDLGTYVPGDSVELPVFATRWEIVPVTPACTGVVRLGLGRVTSSKLTGVVEIVESGKERTKAGLAFFDNGFIANAPATNFGTVQLFNPAASGRRVIVQKLTTSCDQTTTVNFAFTATQAATLRRKVVSKLSGGAAGQSEIRTENGAASLAVSAQLQRAVQANVVNLVDLREPLVLVPGQGLAVWATPVAAVYGLFADFELFEEPL